MGGRGRWGKEEMGSEGGQGTRRGVGKVKEMKGVKISFEYFFGSLQKEYFVI